MSLLELSRADLTNVLNGNILILLPSIIFKVLCVLFYAFMNPSLSGQDCCDYYFFISWEKITLMLN